jgi:23S rRNA pseudouridine2604 synthase
MSDSDQGNSPKNSAGDDPWGKWRKPESAEKSPAEKTPEPVESKPTFKPRPAPKPEPVVKSELKPAPSVAPPVVDLPRERPAGTLGVNRAAVEAAKPTAKKFDKKPSSGHARRNPPRSDSDSPWGRVPVAKGAATTIRISPQEGVRLSKVMSERAMCSRREADLWIERGWVLVNGERISELGTRINPDAEITISKDAERDQAKQVTILLNKPVGYVSGQPEPGCIPAITLITQENQLKQPGTPEFKPWMLRSLAPAGRLDIDSTGLLVLTQDGRVAKKLIGEDSQAEKEYLVRVSGEMIPGGLRLLGIGLELDGKPLKQAWVKQLNEDQLHFILKEGKKRQIRRMCEAVGLTVIGLKRVRIGRVRLGELPLGQWRFLRPDESF